MENEIPTSDLYLKGHRTLTTVVFTDCVGFSARMSVDEEHTFDLIRRDLKLMKQVCEQFEGRVLKTTGDGLLMCFSSAVKAVECAVEIQRAIAEAASKLPPNDSLLHRIGIHLADMYITKTDVMGNGVNIAARLQTEADPGGICISQTVYDVAKHGLQLRAKYLGPRELKNIREVVPAYKILLESDELTDDPYAEAIHHLEQSSNLLRIKKLLFYVCKNRWEGDQSKVEALNLKALLQEFLGFAPTYDQLKGLLDAAVGTLSKRTEYALIASEILSQAARFYAQEHNPYSPQASQAIRSDQQAESNGLKPDPTSPFRFQSSHLQQIYEQITQDLEQHEDEDFLRIKKLLVYVCKGQWESDPTRLSKIHTIDLVRDLHYVVPESDQLVGLIDRFVQTLNKQAEYSLVANLLIRDLGKLYPDLSPGANIINPNRFGSPELASRPLSNAGAALSSTERSRFYAEIAAELDGSPQVLRVKKLIVYICRSQWVSDSALLFSISTVTLIEELHRLAPTLERLELALEAVVRTLSKRAEYTAISDSIVHRMRRLYLAQDEELPASGSPPDSNPSSRLHGEPELNQAVLEADRDRQLPANLFDVRLGIMKYANPLKAKILLFSTLNPDFTFSYQDWFNLRQYELDGLLRDVLQTCKTYTDLEFLLYNTAKRLRESDELVQTADAVIKCLRSVYLNSRSVLASAESVEADGINLNDFEQATQKLAIVDDSYDDTHQLYPSSLELESVTEFPVNAAKKTSLFPAE
ncbi:MAG: adenylate/guanylate cyclase domain-containing protein [Leptolyngbyaceae cyanobacterium RU_5_1]|nr:adenylate/guanylate cyclase domain-containing protein [Leptolyngbyaceae cyanobacterium RU_5_1]